MLTEKTMGSLTDREDDDESDGDNEQRRQRGRRRRRRTDDEDDGQIVHFAASIIRLYAMRTSILKQQKLLKP